MTDPPITVLLRQAREGDASAREALIPLLYRELHRLAEIAFRGEKPGHTLQPTILVHEAFFKLFQGSVTPEFADRAHLLRIAARLMRQILVDHARSRRAQKRGVQFTVCLDERIVSSTETIDFVELDQALETLNREDSELVTLVEMRFIAGMTAEEVAEVRCESVSTVRRDVRYAIARLQTLLSNTAG